MARSNLSKAARAVAAKGGTALPNGKYPIRTRRELMAAIKLRHHSTEPYAKVSAHIRKRAAALGVKLKAGQVASAGPGMTVFACLEKACAPPPVGKGGSSKSSAKSHPIITAAEARGDSKPVSRAEFQRLASIGQSKLDTMSANASPIRGLDDNWGKVKADSYEEATKPWGGATIDSHTGKALPQGANRYALTVKEKGGDTVSIPENATRQEFDTAMDRAKERFRSILEREGHHLGVFHDDDLGRIDIDPVLVVNRLRDVHTIGAATRAIGGAYNFADGQGYWPAHVAE